MLFVIVGYAVACFAIGAVLARRESESGYFPFAVFVMLLPPVSLPVVWLASRLAKR